MNSSGSEVRGAAAVRWYPLRLMVTFWSGLRACMTRLMLIPVTSWR